MRILGIESSCDDTAAAVVDDGPRLVASVVYSQTAVHAGFGGVVPEVASREHITRVVEVTDGALAQAPDLGTLDGIAVTSGPGLIGSLLVGLQFAKGLALARALPWIGINHLEAHLAAALLADPAPEYPYVALLVSGGHTHLYLVKDFGAYRALGGTRDDAAGEAFDKVAKLLGLGYPGGVAIEKHGSGGDPAALRLPRGIPSTKIPDFSFSGLKTAAAEHLRKCGPLRGTPLQDFCASVQEAICDILTKKAVAQALAHGVPGVVLAGGVAANSRLRELMGTRAAAAGLWSFVPPRSLCTDNAAMVAAAGWKRLSAGESSPWSHGARARWPLGGERGRGPPPKVRRGGAGRLG